MDRCLAIIPARGGSKRIPRKNVRHFLGAPIVTYSIRSALQSKVFSRVMVSTDDGEIVEVAKDSGAEVPFLRSPDTSDDSAILADVVLEVLEKYRALGEEFDYCCCLLATAPLVCAADLRESYLKLRAADAGSLVSIVRFGFPIHRAFHLRDGHLQMVWPENMHKHSREFETCYHDAGQFYWLKVGTFEVERKLYTRLCLAHELPETRAQDIDTEEDWQIAELKYQLMATAGSKA